MASNSSLSPTPGNDVDIDDDDSFLLDDQNVREISDEDTEDASETETNKQNEQFTGIKDQMYQDKLAHLKKQLMQLKGGTLPEYMKKLKRLEQQYKERVRVNEIWLQYEQELVEKEYIMEKKESIDEYEDKKIELKENLIMELDDKKRMMESERNTMELTGDSMEVKSITTRKLRRRPNEPIPLPEKRRKPSPDLNYELSEEEVMEDLRIINKISGKPLTKKPLPSPVPPATNTENVFEARIDDGRLYYEKRWFHRGQPVFVEAKDSGKVGAVISAVGTQEVWLRKTADNSKLRVYVSQLQKGKYIIRRR